MTMFNLNSKWHNHVSELQGRTYFSKEAVR